MKIPSVFTSVEPPQFARTAIVLGASGVVFFVMLFWGINASTAPFGETLTTSSGQECSEAEKSVRTHVRRENIQVSVYNASDQKGLAGDVLTDLEELGFRPGALGNAPDNLAPKVATVYVTDTTSTSARLVARTLGKRTPIRELDQDLGPGINIVVGPKYKTLNPKAPKKLALPEPDVTCISVT